MKNINFPILHILIPFIGGILVYQNLDIGPYVLLCAFIGLLSTLYILHHLAIKRRFSEIPFIIVTLLLFYTLGYATRYASDALHKQNHYTHKITTSSQELLLSIKEELKPSKFKHKFIAEIHKIDQHRSVGSVLLNVQKDSLSTPKIGQWFYTKNKISKLPLAKNPYQFDYAGYLEKREIHGQLSLASHELYKLEYTSSGMRILSSRFRESVITKLHTYSFTSSQLAIMEALLLGKRQNIDKQISTDYAAAGMMHILAVSGLHVGIILLLLRFAFRFMNWYKLRWVRSLCIISLIWCFAFVTGLSPSVLRAATMFSFLEIGRSLGGKRNSSDAVIVSALLLLIYDPLLIYQIGFQLSYLAVIAILWIQPWLSSFYKPKMYLDKLFWGIATVTVAAQLGVMPLSLYYFHQFPGLFFISNIVILPFLALILGSGLLVILLALVWRVPDFLVSSYGFVIDLMNSYIHWVASQESFIATHIAISERLLIVSYIGIFSIIMFLMKYSRKRLIVATLSIVILTATLLSERQYPEKSHVYILNKNRSTAISYLKNNRLHLFHNDSSLNPPTDYTIKSYRDALPIRDLEIKKLKNYYTFNQKELLVVDSLGIYKSSVLNPDYILLTQSPKVNLSRMIAIYPTATIIADGSNYKSYVQRWRATCTKQNVPFHSTYEKGAYQLK